MRFALIALTLAACTPANTARDVATLRVVGEPENMSVYVDEHFVGTAAVLSQRPAAMLAGHHRVTFTANGYFPHDVEIDAPAGETRVQMRLRAVPQ